MGRNIELTETGQLALSYADEIFSLGGELDEMLQNLPNGRPLVFKVGVADVVPKSSACRLLAPALQLPEPVRIICRENSIEALLADLAVHRIDLVITDGPIPSGLNVRGFNHSLGVCSPTFFATPKLAHRLSGAPFLLPDETTEVRGQHQKWFDKHSIYPHIVGEFDDSALMKAFGRTGTGIFIAPTPITEEVEKQYDVVAIGQTDEVRDHFYAISVERKISHPAVAAITETARDWLDPSEPRRPVRKTKSRKKL